MATHATPEHHARVAALTFASVYPHYIAKVEKKGRSEAELLEVIHWLTGYTKADLERHVAAKSTFQTFFDGADLHANAHLISGTICGYKIQDLDNELTRAVRYLDKLVDELAKGRPMPKILRGS
ncbi:MAG: DUF2200 domain-containing protein [Bacteroidetes bacterium]|nr:DUF2200 domain-containing protein [Bacteroidota bacterium]MDA0898786.1 DUF2200 domain-containing protein [Bacteroidota bacterium]